MLTRIVLHSLTARRHLRSTTREFSCADQSSPYKTSPRLTLASAYGKTTTSVTTPSYVAFTETERLIDDAAKNQVAVNASNTVFDAKRLIGRRFNDPAVAADRKHWPFSVVDGAGGKPTIEGIFKGEKNKFAPEEISSMVLLKMKEIAEAYLGKEVLVGLWISRKYFRRLYSVQNIAMCVVYYCYDERLGVHTS